MERKKKLEKKRKSEKLEQLEQLGKEIKANTLDTTVVVVKVANSNSPPPPPPMPPVVAVVAPVIVKVVVVKAKAKPELSSILDDIKNGIKLRSIPPKDIKKKEANEMNELKLEMDKRRQFLRVESASTDDWDDKE